jgi:hypothetical protein
LSCFVSLSIITGIACFTQRKKNKKIHFFRVHHHPHHFARMSKTRIFPIASTLFSRHRGHVKIVVIVTTLCAAVIKVALLLMNGNKSSFIFSSQRQVQESIFSADDTDSFVLTGLSSSSSNHTIEVGNMSGIVNARPPLSSSSSSLGGVFGASFNRSQINNIASPALNSAAWNVLVGNNFSVHFPANFGGGTTTATLSPSTTKPLPSTATTVAPITSTTTTTAAATTTTTTTATTTMALPPSSTEAPPVTTAVPLTISTTTRRPLEPLPRSFVGFDVSVTGTTGSLTMNSNAMRNDFLQYFMGAGLPPEESFESFNATSDPVNLIESIALNNTIGTVTLIPFFASYFRDQPNAAKGLFATDGMNFLEIQRNSQSGQSLTIDVPTQPVVVGIGLKLIGNVTGNGMLIVLCDNSGTILQIPASNEREIGVAFVGYINEIGICYVVLLDDMAGAGTYEDDATYAIDQLTVIASSNLNT